MHIRTNFGIIFIIFIIFSFAVVSAADSNGTDISQVLYNDTVNIEKTDNEADIISDEPEANDTQSNSSKAIEKTNPVISISSTTVYSKDTLEIHLKNSSGDSLSSKKISGHS